jgi:hypothetical protein
MFFPWNTLFPAFQKTSNFDAPSSGVDFFGIAYHDLTAKVR